MKYPPKSQRSSRSRGYVGSGRLAAVALLASTVSAGAVAWGCGSASSATDPVSQYANPPGTGGSGGGGNQDGLPCDVAAVIAAHCLDCHSNALKGGAPMPLMSYADLAAMSDVDPTMTLAQRSVIRMNDAASPMPPGAGVSVPASDIAVLQAWVDAGLPMGNCDSPDAGPDPFEAPAQCTSNKYWTLGDEGSKHMHPGLACIDCHKQSGEEDATIFAVAGTVYPTAHEPDDCVATGVQGAIVEITEANGTVSSLQVNSSGNFSLEKFGFQTPYTAKVIFNGVERVMHAEQTEGDCNSCHTQDGVQDAPGRILLPF